MQPTFLPWAGYIKMISIVDSFVFLDDVQLSPKSFQIRNRIPWSNNEPKWLTVHHETNQDYRSRFLNNTFLKNAKNDFYSISQLLLNRYKKSEEMNYLLDNLEFSLQDNKPISEINISLIKSICHLLNIKSNFYLSSSINTDKKGSDKVVELLNSFDCSQYISAPGSISYMQNEEIWSHQNFSISIFNFYLSHYSQTNYLNFLPNMSVIDLILELGANKSQDLLLNSNHVLTPWLK